MVTSLLNTVIFSPVVAISAFLLSWRTVVCHGAVRLGAHGPLRGSVPSRPLFLAGHVTPWRPPFLFAKRWVLDQVT